MKEKIMCYACPGCNSVFYMPVNLQGSNFYCPKCNLESQIGFLSIEKEKLFKNCFFCKKEIVSLIPNICKRCNQYFCVFHRLPENHNCPSLRNGWDKYKEQQDKYER